MNKPIKWLCKEPLDCSTVLQRTFIGTSLALFRVQFRTLSFYLEPNTVQLKVHILVQQRVLLYMNEYTVQQNTFLFIHVFSFINKHSFGNVQVYQMNHTTINNAKFHITHGVFFVSLKQQLNIQKPV